MTAAAEATGPTRGAAVRDVAIQLVGRVGNLALGVVVTILIVRGLGVDGNGQWVTLLAVQAIVGTVAELGLEPNAVRRAAAAPEEEGEWLGALLVLRLLLALPAGVLTYLVCSAEASSSAMRTAGALIAGTLVVQAPMSLRAAFQLKMRNDRTILVITFNSVIWTAAVIGVAAAGGGLVAFAAALMLTTAVTTVFQTVWVLRGTRLAFDRVRVHGRELLRVGIALGIASMLTFAYGRIDQLLVLHYTGERGAGLYGTAYLLLDRIQFLPAAIMATTFPLISAAWPADPERTRRLVQQVLEAMALISVPALAFTIAAARPAIVLLFGEEFAPAAGVLPVLMLAFMSTCFGYLMGFLAIVVDRQKSFVWIAIVALVFNVVANVILLPRHGYIAAAWVTVATEVIVITSAARISLSPLQLPFRPGRLPNALLAGAIMSVVVALARHAGLGAIGLGLVAAVVYPAAVLACGGLSPEDRARVLGRLGIGRAGGRGAPPSGPGEESGA
jgi:O-antigen/teichoic acid export membrane protein